MLKLQLDLFYAVWNVESTIVLFARNAKFTVVLVEITIVIVFLYSQGMLNSIMNPIIYAFWYAQFRLRISKAWKQLFRSCF